MELVIGILIFLIGGFIFGDSFTFPRMEGSHYPGPGFFPKIVGLSLMVLSIIIILKNIRRRAWPRLPRIKEKKHEIINISAVIASILFYIYVSDLLGFLITVSLIMIFLMWLLGVSLKKSIPFGIGTAVVTYLLFYKLLAVPLPGGLLMW